jgi:hypothetical protein
MTTNLLLDRILLIDKGILSLALMSLGLSILEYNLEFNYKQEDKSNTQRIYNILLIVSGINLLMIVFNILRTTLMNKFYIAKGMREPSSTLKSSGKLPWLCLESLLIFMGPSPFLIGMKYHTENIIIASDIYYMYNDSLHILQLYKTWLILRSVLTNSPFATNRAYRICQFYGRESNIEWVIRSFMRKRPFRFVFEIFILGIVFFAYALRIAESPLTRKVSIFFKVNFKLIGCRCMIWTTMTSQTVAGKQS